jgi:hypothetical protein
VTAQAPLLPPEPVRCWCGAPAREPVRDGEGRLISQPVLCRAHDRERALSRPNRCRLDA